MTSNIKEYIQGCISVWFSYKIGNVFPKPAGQVFGLCRCRVFVLRDNFLTLSQLHRLVNNFFKKFFQSCVTGVLGDKKMKRTISPSRNRFISSS